MTLTTPTPAHQRIQSLCLNIKILLLSCPSSISSLHTFYKMVSFTIQIHSSSQILDFLDLFLLKIY